MEERYVRTGSGARAGIDLGALAANAAVAREAAGGRDVIAVVKADAYGHGVLPIVRALLAAGVSSLAVVTVEEVAELRDGGVEAPILALGGPLDRVEARELVARGATAVLHHEEGRRRMVEAAESAGPGTRCGVQIEVDTGMRRMGVPSPDAAAFAARVRDERALDLQGVFTHFACADDPDPASAIAQCASFRAVLAQLHAAGIVPPQIHAANSAALLDPALVGALPEATAVRPGLMLFGVQPAAHLGAGRLTPVMTVSAPVVRIHELRRGESVGYGATFTAGRDTRVATLAAGYADGVAWRAGGQAGRGRVWLAGALRPVAGRVSMDSIGVEIGDAAVALGDRAILFGCGEGQGYSVENAAADVDTVAYELLVRVGRRVARHYRERDVAGA